MNGGGYAYALSRIQPELVYHAQAQDMEALDDDDFNLQSFLSHLLTRYLFLFRIIKHLVRLLASRDTLLKNFSRS